MEKSPDAFRTISEVADLLETPAHVLRFWESRFPQIRPVKRAGGRRYYRPSDVALLCGIKRLLHDEGMTIRGVQKILREQGVRHVAGLNGEVSAEEEALEAAMLAALQDEEGGPLPLPGAAEEATVASLAAALDGAVGPVVVPFPGTVAQAAVPSAPVDDVDAGLPAPVDAAIAGQDAAMDRGPAEEPTGPAPDAPPSAATAARQAPEPTAAPDAEPEAPPTPDETMPTDPAPDPAAWTPPDFPEVDLFAHAEARSRQAPAPSDSPAPPEAAAATDASAQPANGPVPPAAAGDSPSVSEGLEDMPTPIANRLRRLTRRGMAPHAAAARPLADRLTALAARLAAASPGRRG